LLVLAGLAFACAFVAVEDLAEEPEYVAELLCISKDRRAHEVLKRAQTSNRMTRKAIAATMDCEN
jgi:hypothetical protein